MQDVNYLHKDEYIRAYTKCLLQFIEELTAHYDPTPDLINKNLEQDQIDLSFNIAKKRYKRGIRQISFLYLSDHPHPCI